VAWHSGPGLERHCEPAGQQKTAALPDAQGVSPETDPSGLKQVCAAEAHSASKRLERKMRRNIPGIWGRRGRKSVSDPQAIRIAKGGVEVINRPCRALPAE
jgi:hypothetical protein